MTEEFNENVVEVETIEGWKKYEGSWFNLIEDGWKFEYLDLDGCVVMTRHGYINRFWLMGSVEK